MSDVQAVDDLMGELDFSPSALKSKYLEERDKRIRTDGNDQYIEVTAEFSHYVDDPYAQATEREPLFDEVEVAVIGGGFGGLQGSGGAVEGVAALLPAHGRYQS